MKISHIITENRKKLYEGGNLAVRGYEAQHLDLKVTDRSYIVPILNNLLISIDKEFQKRFKEPLWNSELLKSQEFLSGSSLHFFNVKNVPDVEFVKKKPTVGDMDTMVSKDKELQLREFLTEYEDKQIGNAILRGFQRGNEQFSSLWELQNPPITVQIDFEFVEFEDDKPTDWARFSHSSSWEDLQQGVKGVFHKWLIQAFTMLTRQEFYLRKMVGRGKARTEQDVPTVDNMYSFAVSSKEGGGLRAKYEPVLDAATGKPEYKDGKPVMKAAPTSGYQQNIGQIFSTILGKRLTPQMMNAASQKFWSFTGLVDLMKELLTPAEKETVLQGFLQKTIGPGAQGMYKNNPDKDITEKTIAINYLLSVLNMNKPSNLDQMINDYRASYKMTADDSETNEVVKSMAKNALDEAAPNYKRKGIPHIYNPGSSVEMKDAEFIDMCKEIASMNGKLDSAPINLKVDGAGIRFGKDEQGKPFFMTSKVTEPKYIENYGDFTNYGKSIGQDAERLSFTKQYDEALKTIVNADFMKSIPADTIVQAEMLFNPMGKKEDGGLKFVNIPYDTKKLGTVMTLVPFSVRQYSTGETRPDAMKIKQALINDSNKQIKLVNNQLSQKNLDVSSIVDPIANNAQSLLAAVKSRGDSETKTKAKEIISHAKKQLSDSIINSPNLNGKDQLGNIIEGLVINLPSGRVVKVTSQQMKDLMTKKMAMNKKPTTGSQRFKPAVVTIGSFAGHKGHQQLIDQTIATAKKVNGDPYIYVSPTVGPDDPIPPEMKVATLQKLYPEYANNIQVWNPAGNAVKKIEKELVLPTNSPYNKIILLVGSDRYEGFKNWMDSLEKRMKDPVALAKYGGTQNQVDFDTIKTEREEGKGGTGISFTMLRDILKNPNASEQDKLKLWASAFDTDKLGIDWVKKLMDTTAKNMQVQQVKEYISRIKPLLGEATVAQKAKFVKLLSEAKKSMANEGIFDVFKKKLKKPELDLPRWPNSNDANEWMAAKADYYAKHNPENLPYLFSPTSGDYLPMSVHVGSSWKPEHLKFYRELKKKYPEAVEKAKDITTGIAGRVSLSRVGDEQDFHGMHLSEYNIRKTKKFIQRAHDQEQGQMYGSMPYSEHPKQVARLGKRFFGNKFGPEAVKVALLHDVLEDTPYTPEQLARKGFSKEVIDAVQLLTKNKSLSYADNIKNIINSGNILAMMVKYCDNYMNYTGDKSHWSLDRAAASQKKYLASLNMLGDVLGIKKHVGDEELVETSGNVYSKGQASIIKDLGNNYFLGDDSYYDDEGFVKEGYSVYYQEGPNEFRKVGNVNVTTYNPKTIDIEREIERLIVQDQQIDEEKSSVEHAYLDPQTHDIMAYAKQHYPEEPDLQAAFVKFVLRSLKHSKEDDDRQDNEIELLLKRVNSLQDTVNKLKEKPAQKVDENKDYLEEK